MPLSHALCRRISGVATFANEEVVELLLFDAANRYSGHLVAKGSTETVYIVEGATVVQALSRAPPHAMACPNCQSVGTCALEGHRTR